MVMSFSLISSQKLMRIRIPYVDNYLKCRLFFRRFKKDPWNLSFFFFLLSLASDSDANGHRPHCKTPLFFTRLGFIEAINHTFANLENSSLKP